ncbi:hypothetical protein [Halobacillus naozhouensis]|uniref:Uncharacterized protein n=1 Tax=Halobacillus naozhouensis TaxID=554880 RepID=A0ABY8J5L1_9BACI|nr:hypothetical protein [Halobacillus naozhouensis]WFT76241.1 hypothetical protein P9989_07725 [Halobacillus naozhouensis]
MPKPPMNDDIKVYNPMLDKSGDRVTNDYGRYQYERAQSSKARVKYKVETDETLDGINFVEIAEINIPTKTKILKGARISWVSRFGELIESDVEGVEEVLNYSGKKVYYRTVYFNQSPS